MGILSITSSVSIDTQTNHEFNDTLGFDNGVSAPINRPSDRIRKRRKKIIRIVKKKEIVNGNRLHRNIKMARDRKFPTT